jgi:hypothetical protein
VCQTKSQQAIFIATCRWVQGAAGLHLRQKLFAAGISDSRQYPCRPSAQLRVPVGHGRMCPVCSRCLVHTVNRKGLRDEAHINTVCIIALYPTEEKSEQMWIQKSVEAEGYKFKKMCEVRVIRERVYCICKRGVKEWTKEKKRCKFVLFGKQGFGWLSQE